MLRACGWVRPGCHCGPDPDQNFGFGRMVLRPGCHCGPDPQSCPFRPGRAI